MSRTNYAIIGMPGSGKSTFGKRLAQAKQLQFVDTDLLMEKQFGCSLQTVVDRRGLKYMRELEAQTVCGLDVEDTVIAPGGSVVYSAEAMLHLQQIATIVYLEINLPTLLQRVDNTAARGLFKLPATSLQGLYFERRDLYQQWAHISLSNNSPLTAFQFDRLLKAIEAAA